MSENPKETEADKLVEKLKKKYAIRSFKTTTEAMTFAQKLSKGMSKMPDGIDSEDIGELFEFLSPELIKYIMTNFVVRKDKKPMDYEQHFKEDINSPLILVMMAVSKLGAKLGGSEKKSQEVQETKPASTKRRLS